MSNSIIRVRHKGNFNRIENFFKGAKELSIQHHLKKCGEEGLEALVAATPVRTGKTAASWKYEIKMDSEKGRYEVVWENTNVENGWANVALLIQLGHGTRNGGYVEGIDYINPALKPVFDKLADDVWKKVISL